MNETIFSLQINSVCIVAWAAAVIIDDVLYVMLLTAEMSIMLI